MEYEAAPDRPNLKSEIDILILTARTELFSEYVKKAIEEKCRGLPFYKKAKCVQDLEREIYKELYSPYMTPFNPFLPFDPEYVDVFYRLWNYGDKLVRLEDPIYGDYL